MRHLPMPNIGMRRVMLAACLMIFICGCDGPSKKVQPQGTAKQSERPAQVAATGDNQGETKIGSAEPTTAPPEKPVTIATPPATQPAPSASLPERASVVDGQMTPSGEEDIGVRPPSAEADVQAEKENMKLQVEDHIFALIRLEMERMLIERRELLAAGRPRHDEGVRRLEDSIMRAQNYLMEAGEDVEPPDPPIVESLAKPPAATQPASAPSIP